MRHSTVFVFAALVFCSGFLSAAEADNARVTLKTSNENIRLVLEEIAQQTGYNIVLPETIQMTISVALRDVSLVKALDAILILNGMRYSIQDKTILIYTEQDKERVKDLTPPTPLKVKIFQLNHITVNTVQKSIEGLLSPRGKMMVLPPTPPETWTTQTEFLSDQAAATKTAGTMDVKPEERSKRFFVLDEQTNLDLIADVITQVDTPKKQVFISTVIFEMRLSEEEAVGLRWTLSGNAGGSSLPWNFPFGHGDLGEFSPHVSATEDLFSIRPGMFPDNEATDFLFGQLNMTSTQLLFQLNKLGANVNILSNPRLMVTDGDEAVILVGERYPILTSTVTDEGTVTETFDRYEPIGVQLRVIPNIQDNGRVSMLIEPQVTDVGAVVVGTTGLSYPRISTRKVESKITVSDGDSLVIAGLVKEDETVNTNGVPLLSDIPILGYLFRHRSVTKEKIDLVVVVTPYINKPPATTEIEREMEKSGFRPSIKSKTALGELSIDRIYKASSKQKQ